MDLKFEVHDLSCFDLTSKQLNLVAYCSGKFMTIKLWISLTSIKLESPPCFYCFQGKMEKYEQNPKIRSFQIKTNKIPEITGKGVGYTEGRC